MMLTQNNQITVRVESGIYDEHLPIKLPENVSIKGDEFRRCVIRPKLGVSQSRQANTYFYRDVDILPSLAKNDEVQDKYNELEGVSEGDNSSDYQLNILEMHVDLDLEEFEDTQSDEKNEANSMLFGAVRVG